MEVKNLFDTTVKQDIIKRIGTLTPQNQAVWGKMNVTQMLAHCQMPLGVATGKHKLKRNFFLSLIGPMFKKKLYDEVPFKHSLPTDKSFIITNPQDFEKEKQNENDHSDHADRLDLAIQIGLGAFLHGGRDLSHPFIT